MDLSSSFGEHCITQRIDLRRTCSYPEEGVIAFLLQNARTVDAQTVVTTYRESNSVFTIASVHVNIQNRMIEDATKTKYTTSNVSIMIFGTTETFKLTQSPSNFAFCSEKTF